MTVLLFTVVTAGGTGAADNSLGSKINSPTDVLQPGGVLSLCLEQRYGFDFIEEIRIVQRDDISSDERTTQIQMIRKTIGSRVHSLVRFLHPDSMRGTHVLTIEQGDRGDDHFVFLRSQQKVRRVRSRRGDSFVGTDFSMEDLERRERSDFEVLNMTETEVHGEAVYVVGVKPLYDSAYFRMEYLVAEKDFTNLGIRYFKENADKPFKEMFVPRETIQEFRDGLLLGMHAYVRDFRRKTETHVYLDKVKIDPPLQDSLFTTSSLHLDRKVSGSD